MRILHIASGDFFSTYGGGQVYVKNVVDCMIDAGLDVAIISAVGSFPYLTVNRYRDHQIVEIPTSADEATLREAILLSKPDIIHAHSLKALACRIGQSLNIPVVVTSHHGGILCPAGTRLNCKDEICHSKVNHKDCLPCVLRNTRTGLRYWYPFMRLLPRKAYLRIGEFLKNKRFILFITPIGMAAQYIEGKIQEWNEIADKCCRVIAPCKAIAEAMIQNGLDEEKVNILPHGIPLPDHRPDYQAVINGCVKFYYVGRICYVKGIHVLLEAFSRVNNTKMELHLIGGTGNKQEEQYMQTLQEKYRNAPRIVWHGKVAPEAVYEITKDFHVSCSTPIYLEAFGLNIAEALALGKPVLATRCGGGEMQIEDGVNGWLVPTNDILTLSDKIRNIAEHPEVLPQMSLNCHATSIAAHCDQLLRIYRETLEQCH
jgi:glycosyltransferase involved in cell wall biosynthesis